MYESFISDVKDLINLCNTELFKRKSGILGESSIEQLDQIIQELNGLLDKISTCNIPTKSNRYLVSFAYAFKEWGWNMQNPTELYVLLCKLNTSYKNLE